MKEQTETVRRSRPLGVLLADDHARVLAAATQLLNTGYRILATVADGLRALESAEQLNPDIVILDIGMPKLDGIETARALRQSGCRAKIIFLTVLDDDAHITAARSYGDGYVLKSRMYSDLPRAIEEALAGGFFVSARNPHI
jgi:two-component system nitrate/nitrite response regulator NarL